MAIYNLSLTSVTDALISAQARGVKVRLVMESQSISRNQPQRLIQAGIPIHGDEREGLMHNKFTIIDRQDVWMGSMNYTSTSFYKDFNNLVHLPSSEAAQDYTTEFNEMFDDNLFGSDTRAATPYPLLTIGDVQVEIYFSPDDGVADQVIEEIRSARTSIDFLAYSFTSNDIADAVRERAAAGVQVRGVFDEEQVTSNTGGEYDALRQAGISVRRDGISGLMHSKVFIIDGKTVITGSYNFSSNAERVNDENLVILHDPSLGEQYTQNFEAIYANAK
jgi:phosphatidylserine/phosphatidylglycerophosphate/cardiolipin synthase-like enzyme